jgi:hypothetical protein
MAGRSSRYAAHATVSGADATTTAWPHESQRMAGWAGFGPFLICRAISEVQDF